MAGPMIALSDVAQSMLAGYSFQLHNRLSSWLGGEQIADDIPGVEVIEEADGTLRVPETLTFKVPTTDDQGNLWVPIYYDSPLGWFGQRIVAQIGISVGHGAIEWIDRGEFLIESAETEEDVVVVSCVGLLHLVDEAELPNEYQPKAGATLGSILRALMEPGITVDLDEAPTDRAAPTSITWSDNRLDNVLGVLDAWPAQGTITEAGQFEVLPVPGDPVVEDVVFTFTDGQDGTAMRWNTSGSRDGAFNALIAKGQYPDSAGAKAGQEIMATAYDTDPDSPFRIGGAFSPYLVPFGYASPLMTTQAMVQLAANTRFATQRRQAGTTVRISAVPHPGLKVGDAVAVTSDLLGLSGALGSIGAMILPHQAEGGAMAVTVRLVND
jgi:hypothetical protein